ncbi:MAG: trypsin-like peptidase domain-containing protein [Planctomycetota bacterium]
MTRGHAMLLPILILVGCASEPIPVEPILQTTEERAPTVAETFEEVSSAVVTIHAASSAVSIGESGEIVEGFYSVGSGVLVSGTGQVLTASHVVHTADELVVEFPDGALCRAHVEGSVKAADVALVQLDDAVPENAKSVELANSDDVRVGSRCIVVGAPQGISHTLTVGHISARRLEAGYVQRMVRPEFFQTDASINQGNSGGPMFDMEGRVIGIVSYIVTEGGGSEGLGFAVTANVCKELLLEGNPFWWGTEEILVSDRFARALNFPGGRSGLLVQQVTPGSAGDLLGLRGGSIPAVVEGVPVLLGGDVILEISGIALDDEDAPERIIEALSALERSSSFSVRVLRDGRRISLKGDLGEILDRAEEARRARDTGRLLEVLREEREIERTMANRPIMPATDLGGGAP